MGAATAMAFALEQPERVAALVQITPAYAGGGRTGEVERGDWERMASELERGGVDAFVERGGRRRAAGERWREIAREADRQRMERHEHPEAVARALREVPRSAAWDGLEALERLEVPVLVVGSRDDAGSAASARDRRASTPGACPTRELVVEERGRVAAGLAGRPAVDGDRRLPGAGGLPAAPS